MSTWRPAGRRPSRAYKRSTRSGSRQRATNSPPRRSGRRRILKRISLGAVLAGAGALAVLAGSASAQKGDIGIYNGQPVKDSGIKLSAWGSGSAVESAENSFQGPNAIKVTTHGRYQGARIILVSPLDL